MKKSHAQSQRMYVDRNREMVNLDQRKSRTNDPERFREHDRKKYERQKQSLNSWAMLLIFKSRNRAKVRGHKPLIVSQVELIAAWWACGGHCQCCGHEPKELNAWGFPNLVPDHDHDTGKFRVFLCSNCNVIEGFTRDREHWLALGRYMGWLP